MISAAENTPVKLLLTAEEACQALGVCRKTLYTLTKEGGLPVVPIGKNGIRFSVSAVEKWIAKKQESACE